MLCLCNINVYIFYTHVHAHICREVKELYGIGRIEVRSVVETIYQCCNEVWKRVVLGY